MNIKMIGIDHTKAPLEYREKLAFSQTRATQFLSLLKKQQQILGCVLISTCNRTELWISHTDDFINNVDELMCQFKKVDLNEYKQYFVYRQDKEAVEHLFMVTSGLKSKILGEEQIITQVKNAVELSRDKDFLDQTLNILFRNAITASKKIKTEIKFSKGSYSVIDSAIKKLETININVKDKNCLVIGNGEMGRLASSTLIKNGAKVTMTLRQHHKGDVVIPVGVDVVNFLDRVELLPQFDIVFSTTSTNRFMLKYEDVSQVKLKENVVFVDLAVPRDIDKRIYNIDGVTGFNIDDFDINETELEAVKENVEKAKTILTDYINEFYKWYANKDIINIVFDISQKFADDTIFRINKLIDNENKQLVEKATKKSAEKLLFCLRDNLNPEDFKNIVSIIEKNYINEDM